ncbi:Origin recognition complex subunit [Fasciola hepatica]|uniref:Origin recognition complex subunit n=1 Tax=Fasciola hepatica TaxID=6192 RepID=A0A4E0S345_FASHE|nr:Origin recognition complex subunit [Fasciola hepatica]
MVLTMESRNLLTGREKEQLYLESLLKSNLPMAACFVINGPSGCGKSRLISSTFGELERLYNQRWALINCVEGYSSVSHSVFSGVSPKLMFELVLQSVKLRYAPRSSVTCRCDGTPRFIEQLCDLLIEISDKSEDRDVFDQADKLRDADPLLLPLLVRLGSLVEDELCRSQSTPRIISLATVLVTRSPWEKFSSQTFHLEPMVIPITSYTRDQITCILMSLAPSNSDPKCFARFVDLLLTVCFPVCRNAGELIYLMQSNWSAFEEPVNKGLVAADDEWAQWKLAQPTLKRSLANLYLRTQKNRDTKNAVTPYNSSALELPYFTRYLLIAAFMASYNPRTADKKFLVKNSEKQSLRKKKQEKMSEKTKGLLRGPQLFPLDRLLAIFHALLRDESTPVPTSSLLLSQVACLTALGLLSATNPANVVGGFLSTGLGAVASGHHQSEMDPLANPRYRCLLSFETARAVAKSLDFDLPAYLTDFYGV